LDCNGRLCLLQFISMAEEDERWKPVGLKEALDLLTEDTSRGYNVHKVALTDGEEVLNNLFVVFGDQPEAASEQLILDLAKLTGMPIAHLGSLRFHWEEAEKKGGEIERKKEHVLSGGSYHELSPTGENLSILVTFPHEVDAVVSRPEERMPAHLLSKA